MIEKTSPDLSSPEATWNTFVNAVRQKDYDLILKCHVKGGDLYKYVAEKTHVDDLSEGLNKKEIYIRENLNFPEYGALLIEAIDKQSQKRVVLTWAVFVNRENRYLLTSNFEFPTSDWVVKDTPHIRFHYREDRLTQEGAMELAGGKEKLAELFGCREKDIERLEEFYQKASRYLNVELNEKIDYYIFSSKEEFLIVIDRPPYSYIEHTSNDFPIAKYLCKRNKIFSLSTYEPEEIAHALIAQIGNIPIFFDEGLASYVVKKIEKRDLYKINYDDRDVLKSIDNKCFISLSSIVSNKTYNDCSKESFLPKSEANSFVKFLILKYGFNEFKKNVSALTNENYNIVIEKFYGKTINDLEKEWIFNLQNKYSKAKKTIE